MQPLLFLFSICSIHRYADFEAYRAQKPCLLTPFTQIIARSVSKNRLDIQFKHQWKAAFYRDKYRALKCLYEYTNELLSTRLYGLYKAVSPVNRRYAVSQIVWGQSIQRAIINGKVVCFPIKGAEKNHQHEVPFALSYVFAVEPKIRSRHLLVLGQCRNFWSG